MLSGQEKNKIHTSLEAYPHSNTTGEIVPSWVAFDRRVLRFYAYFQESVQERREEKYRIRRVNIYFYLEDDSVHVSEPKTQNSGIPQGTLIRRHRISKEGSESGQHFIVSDFNVGEQVKLYSRTFKIVGCDEFSRGFLQRIGITVGQNSEFPADPYEVCRAEILSRMKATRPTIPNFSLKKFLENDRRVLRFYCVWDDSTSVFGDLRHMVVNYFLSDDTIEIHESIPANSGREANTLFLRRCRLPKKPHRVRVDNGPEKSDAYFSERDLMIGSVIHLYGRPFVICDCDEFTKQFYRDNYGVEDFDPVHIEDYEEEQISLPFFEPAATQLNGAPTLVGGEAHVKKDFRKLMKYDGITLRFLGKLNSTKQVDSDRKFVISFHLADDTISVFEPPARNSGVLGGKFLENKKLKKADGSFYTSNDFYLGNC